ncbi:hypothetical protein LINPERHAP1_LOCUS19609 [Linum perenne]
MVLGLESRFGTCGNTAMNSFSLPSGNRRELLREEVRVGSLLLRQLWLEKFHLTQPKEEGLSLRFPANRALGIGLLLTLMVQCRGIPLELRRVVLFGLVMVRRWVLLLRIWDVVL